MARTADHHYIDDLAQEVWEAVQVRIGWIKAQIAGPVPVGFRKVPPKQQDDLEFDQLLATALGQQGMMAGLSPNLQAAADVLGDYSEVLGPYLGNEGEGE